VLAREQAENIQLISIDWLVQAESQNKKLKNMHYYSFRTYTCRRIDLKAIIDSKQKYSSKSNKLKREFLTQLDLQVSPVKRLAK